MKKLILILSLLASLGSMAQMPATLMSGSGAVILPVLVNQVSAYSNSNLTVTSAATNMTGVTSLIFAVTLDVFSPTAATITIADSKGNTYSLAAKDNEQFSAIYYVTGLTSSNVSSSMTFTATVNNNYESAGIYLTVYGCTGISTLDATNTIASGGGGPYSTLGAPTVTPSHAGEFVVLCAGNIYYGATTALSGGFTLDQSINSGAYGHYNTQAHLITPYTTSISSSLTNGGAEYNYYGCSVATFR